MKTAGTIPVEEYPRNAYRPDCDFIDGECETEVGVSISRVLCCR